MADSNKKSWRNSSNKWIYLKIAIIYFTTPSKVYEIAHKTRGANMRERAIRGRLVERGVLSRGNSSPNNGIDLEKGHI